MTKKVLGINFGRPNGNDEILLKIALNAAREEGCEVELIRFNDLKILPCTGCGACHAPGRGGKCILKDDMPLLEDHIMDADGIIYASPIYIWGPTGGFTAMSDRFGPNRDRVLIKWRNGGDMEKVKEAGYDLRIFKERVGAYIAVGGTMNPNYATMATSLMPCMTHSMQIRIVDELIALDSTMPGHVCKHADKLQKAAELGRNVARSIGVPKEELEWYGAPGTCPYCHHNLFNVSDGNETITCCTCGVEGKVTVNRGRIHVEFDRATQDIRQRETDEEMISHGIEIADHMKLWEPNKEKVMEKMAKYKNYKPTMVKPGPRTNS